VELLEGAVPLADGRPNRLHDHRFSHLGHQGTFLAGSEPTDR
jgi:hypothetical protein